MNSRRKLATYGRISRKASYDLKCSAPYSASETPVLNIWAEELHPIQEVDQISSGKVVISLGDHKVKCLGNNFRETRCSNPVHRHPHNAELGSHHSASEQRPSCEMTNFESKFSDKRSPKISLPEKEGRLESNTEAQEVSIVFDDKSLQCHIATEARSDVAQVPSHQSNLIDERKPKKKPTPPEASLQNINRQYQQSPSATGQQHSEPKKKGLRRREKVSSKPRVYDRLPSTGSYWKDKGVVSAAGVHNLGVPRSDMNPMEIVRESAQEFSFKTRRQESMSSKAREPSLIADGITKDPCSTLGPIRLPRAPTPHQRELWKMLFEDDARKQSNLILEPPSFQDGRQKSDLKEPGETVSNVTLSPQRRKRRRLVDQLNTCEGDHHDIGDALDGQNPSNEVMLDDNMGLNASSVGETPTHSSSCVPNLLSTSSQDQNHSGTSLCKLPMPLPSGKLKVTYARQRSFVTDEALSPAALVDSATVVDQPQVPSGRQSAEKCIQSAFDESLEDTDSQSGTMRSIYELRKAGSNARAVCNMEALLDDIKGETGLSLGYRISRLLGLIVRLQDIPYCRLFVSQGLDLRLLTCHNPRDEPAFKALFAAAILHLLAPSTFPSKLHQTQDLRLPELLLELLDQEGNLKSILKKCSSVMPGTEQADFATSWEALHKSAAWGGVRPLVLTGRVVGLQCLEYLIKHAHGSGQPLGAIPPHGVWSVAQILNSDFSVSIRKPNVRFQRDLQLALSILEMYTIGNRLLIEESIWKGKTLENLKSFLPCLGTWREENIGILRSLTLRLYLNLTNNSPKLCKAFATPDVVGAVLNIIVSHFQRLSQNDCDDPRVLLDSLILALGSMINLAEWCDTARQLVMSLRLKDASFLDILLQLYTSKQLEAREVFSEQEATVNVAFGYLSVLICYLCIDGTTKCHVSMRLQGRTLKQLLDSVEEFMHYHTQVDDAVPQDGLEIDSKANFLHRLRSVIHDLKIARM